MYNSPSRNSGVQFPFQFIWCQLCPMHSILSTEIIYLENKIRRVYILTHNEVIQANLTPDFNPMVRNSHSHPPGDYTHRSRVLETLQIALCFHALHYDLIVYRANVLHIAFSNPWCAPNHCHGSCLYTELAIRNCIGQYMSV